jgi:hypothetical protein
MKAPVNNTGAAHIRTEDFMVNLLFAERRVFPKRRQA